MTAWAVWLLVAAAAVVIELATLTAVFGLFAVALALTAGVAAAGAPTTAQLLFLAATATAEFVFLRPLVAQHLHQPVALRTGVAALTGREAVVTRRIAQHGGRIRIGGESWAAESLYGGVLSEGAVVVIDHVEGATALVYPKELT